jgi:hypothetical protein
VGPLALGYNLITVKGSVGLLILGVAVGVTSAVVFQRLRERQADDADEITHRVQDYLGQLEARLDQMMRTEVAAETTTTA